MFVQDIVASVINVSLSTEGVCTSPEYNLSAASCMASFAGTFVYSDATSNEMTPRQAAGLFFSSCQQFFGWNYLFSVLELNLQTSNAFKNSQNKDAINSNLAE